MQEELQHYKMASMASVAFLTSTASMASMASMAVKNTTTTNKTLQFHEFLSLSCCKTKNVKNKNLFDPSEIILSHFVSLTYLAEIVLSKKKKILE